MGHQETYWRKAAWDAWCLRDENGQWDKKAQNEFCDLVRKPLVCFAMNRGLSLEDAEDVVQDTSLKLIIKDQPAWVSDENKLSKFLFTCVRNRAENLRTRRRNHLSLEGPQASGDADSAGTRIDPIDHKQRPDQQEELSKTNYVLIELIEQLPSDEREVLILKVVVKLTFQEICELLDLPLGVVRGRLERAIQKLREELLRRGIDGNMAPS